MKTTLCLVLFLICAVGVQADWIPFYVENYSFEIPGNGKIRGWDEAMGAFYTADGTPAEVPGWNSDVMPGDSGVESLEDGASDGLYRAYISGWGADASIWQIEPNLIEAGDAFKLSVDARSGQNLIMTIFYYDEGSNQRIPIASRTYATTGDYMEYSMTAIADDVPASIGYRVGIELDNQASGWMAIDNVRFYYDPDTVYLVSPKDQTAFVATNVALQWKANGWPVDLYFTTDPNVTANPSYKKLSEAAVSSYDPGTLERETTYYWKVVAYEPNTMGPDYIAIHETPVWSFTTIPSGPVFITQPQDTAADEGQTVEFTVEVANPADVHYQWRKMLDDVNSISVGTDSSTLTITDAGADDEGDYYCVATNDLGSSTSLKAHLTVYRLLARWTFNDTLDEAAGTGLNGVMFNGGSPQYVPGILGNAIQLTSTGEFVNVPGTENLFDMDAQDMTVAVWVKTTQWNWGDMVTKCTRTSPRAGWTLRHAYDDVDSAMHSSSPGSELRYYASITDDKWHLVVLTFNAETSVMTLYATYTDAAGTFRISKAATSSLTTKTKTTVPLRFGVSAALDGGSIAYQYIGALDDIRIYNYAMNEFQIAENLYHPVTGQGLCLRTDFASQQDFNADCRINLADIAIMAAGWLSSGLYPTVQ